MMPSTDWLVAASARVIGLLEQERSTWQGWHVRAEALRQTRAAGVPSALLDRVVDTLVDLAVDTRSVPLSIADPIQEPDALRRADGQSVYLVPGVEWYTSSRILDAEHRIVAHAGRTDGRAVAPDVIDLALLEVFANGARLTPGQNDLVRTMAGSGRRVQLAIAPAGTGKTTAMRVLGAAWAESGGTVIGLAPSAAAAKALADQLDVPCDTLAKLTWSLDHPEQPQPAWLTSLGPGSLVIIDEAGMADTLSLDRALAEVIARGGNVRLVGDDRQLSAIGAGGVLRDIEAAHGACRLHEVLRFDDPAEAAASTALREGRTEALGYYLDHDRIHVGDIITMANAVLDAWTQDHANGLDALMLAPTRDLVSRLNQLAQQRHHEGRSMIGRGAGLADGNIAVASDLVITRHNARRLPVGSRDWVKNGDRWRVASVAEDGSLRVQSLRSKHVVTLPADYVSEWVDLGYATTIHGAQGLTADTMHGLASGEESRQDIYTMLTRGRLANHLYLQVVGDGDPHGLVHTDATYLLTGVERLERILSHDDVAESASTRLREQDDPARLLAPAVARYSDALGVAAEQVLGAEVGQRIDQEADNLVLWLTECPAWDTLRADLLGLAADGHDPVRLLRETVSMGELDTARDPAAVLDHRLHLVVPEKEPGPLPWLRGVPSRVANDEVWGPYLRARAERVERLADALRWEVRSHHRPPDWLGPMSLSPRMFENGVLLGDITVWRAVMNVPASDLRPTGAPAVGDAAARWQRDLDARLDRSLGTGEWGRRLPSLDPALARDPGRLVIARRLHALAEKGIDVPQVVERALAEGHCRMSMPRPHSGGEYSVRPVRGWAGRPPPRRKCGRPSPRHDDAGQRSNTCPASATTGTAAAHPSASERLSNEGETMSVIESTKPGAFISLSAAADMLGVSVHTLRRRIAAGELPAFRTGRRIIRVRVSDLEAMLKRIPSVDRWRGNELLSGLSQAEG